jgi:hypothetical protein
MDFSELTEPAYFRRGKQDGSCCPVTTNKKSSQRLGFFFVPGTVLMLIQQFPYVKTYEK